MKKQLWILSTRESTGAVSYPVIATSEKEAKKQASIDAGLSEYILDFDECYPIHDSTIKKLNIK